MPQGGWSNDAISTLTIPTGATSGARIVIANPDTGDAVDVYNDANELIFSINADGAAASMTYSPNKFARMDGAEFLVGQGGGIGGMGWIQGGSSSVPSMVQITAQPSHGLDAFLEVQAGSPDASVQPGLIGNTRNVFGSYLQSDQSGSGDLYHVARYAANTNASGVATFTHNCAFEPTNSTISCVGQTRSDQYVVTSYGASTVTMTVHDQSGNLVVNGTTNFTGVFYA